MGGDVRCGIRGARNYKEVRKRKAIGGGAATYTLLGESKNPFTGSQKKYQGLCNALTFGVFFCSNMWVVGGAVTCLGSCRRVSG